jgi:hypothetical protein
VFVVAFSSSTFSQDLMKERIRKLSGRKRSIFLDSGIFHNGGNSNPSTLKMIRHSYKKSQGFERVVFDFSTNKLPRVYGHVDAKRKKMYLDIFDTKLSDTVRSMGTSEYVESVNFFPISKDLLSVELSFKGKVSVDLFYLEKPGRFVVDIKK